MFGGDVINYGFLYPIEWLKNVIEALLIYFMFWASENHFKLENLFLKQFYII